MKRILARVPFLRPIYLQIRQAVGSLRCWWQFRRFIRLSRQSNRPFRLHLRDAWFHPFDATRDRLHLHVGTSGRDHEIVGDRIEMLDLEHHQIVSLLFECRLGDGQRFV